jgi:hypothetical protein
MPTNKLFLAGGSAAHLPGQGYLIDEFHSSTPGCEDDLQLTLRSAPLNLTVLNQPLALCSPSCPVDRAATASAASTGLFDVNGSGRLTYGTFIIVSAQRSQLTRTP